ncbi:sugar phosphate isomerase/epimerase [Paenibacillus sp. H1-7]|uniref:sugar phosphate isomerase/epimerase family protein n=1 Tax=Paenibacillus sp. H1-7 TaxID=2282849 RepID=UPI001EF9B298|nr:sugar phosphate isomerase/epimerase family protein [Paenibacillus sp. H1-7]ULL19030.1 sugar phosphate isomerase/epimerase [Paenibacillus sp. H1-7]
MKYSISNIAWNSVEDEAIINLLPSYGFTGVEIAPTKINEKPLEITKDDAREYKKYWLSKNIEVVAMQSLLYGRPDLTIFGDKKTRKETLEYLIKIIELGVQIGVKAFVFGSPKNRLVGNTPKDTINEIALSFFGKLGEVANSHGAVFCIEPNPRDYGCDYIINTNEAIELVKNVNQRGFGLHLDAAAMTLNSEDIPLVLESAIDYTNHFHISEPYLEPIGSSGKVNHSSIAAVLKKLNYSKYISIEMKQQSQDSSNKSIVAKSLDFVSKTYNLI